MSVQASQHTAGVFRFGPFDFEPRSGELRKHGRRVRLQSKPRIVLELLLDRTGDFVTREQLRARLWSDGTNVDFDNSLNAALSRLRTVLGDSATDCRYIETVDRRGYRFVGVVEMVPFERPGREASESENVPRLEPQRAGLAGPSVVCGETAERGRSRTNAVGLSLKQCFYVTLAITLTAAALGFTYKRFEPSGRTVGGTPSLLVPLTSLPGLERQVSFSPDGTRMAFVWDGGTERNVDVYVKLVDTGPPLRLTRDPAEDTQPVWSPDGRRIAFVREGEDRGVFVVPPLAGPERRLTATDAPFPFSTWQRLAWVPDGRSLIVADNTAPSGPVVLFRISIESGDRERLTSPPAGALGDSSPTFSPDGGVLAFARHVRPGAAEVYVMEMPGGKPRQLTSGARAMDGLAWSRDGKELVMASKQGSGSVSHLWRVRVSDGSVERLPVPSERLSDPAFTPDGRYVAFTQTQLDLNIWRLPLSGGPAQPLVASTLEDVGERYSPDGSRIAFASNRSGTWEIWTCGNQGEDPAQLTNFGGPNVGNPRWSPDGRTLAFQVRHAEGDGVWVIRSDGGGRRQIWRNPSGLYVTEWSRDGRWLYAASSQTGRFEIWKFALDGGHVHQVTRHGGFMAMESADSKYLYYTKAWRVPGIWRMPVEGGSERLLIADQRAGASGLWTVVDDGIFFASAGTGSSSTVWFFEFATERLRPVARLRNPILEGISGLSVSPDRRWLLVTQLDEEKSDIKMIEYAGRR
jgi:Tol biopolymer transport system component/DNA-binding winged helix-turn-helix (wHTH) protein